MANGLSRFLLSAVLVVVLLIGMLLATLGYFGLLFKLEVIGLVVLAFLSLIGLTFSRNRSGAGFLFAVGLLAALNVLLLAWTNHGMQWFLLVVAVLLLIVNIIPQKKGSKTPKEEAPKSPASVPEHSQVFDPVEKKVASKKTPKKSARRPSGRFVASKRSSLYHVPKCEWARKINPQRKVTFKTKEEAWEKGYKAHDCIKN